MKTIFDNKTSNAVLRDSKTRNQAEIFDDSNSSLFEIQSITLDLTTARETGNPYKISMPLRSVFVRDASDSNTFVNFFPSTVDSYQSAAKLTLNDSLEFGRQLSGANLTWDAQAGKSVTLIFFVSSFFRSGSQVSQTAGGIAIIDGSSFEQSVVSLTAATATVIVSQDTTRKQLTLTNESGADVWVGNSLVVNSGSARGFKVANGAIFTWRNTAALYGYSVAGGEVHLTQEF